MSFAAVPSKPKILSKFTSPNREISQCMKENTIGGFMSPQIYLTKNSENSLPYGANPFQSPQSRIQNIENMHQMGYNNGPNGNHPSLGQNQGRLIVMASPSSNKYPAQPCQIIPQFASPKTGRIENMYQPQLMPMGIQVPQKSRPREPLQDNTSFYQAQRNIHDYSSPLRAKGNVFQPNYHQVEAKITLKPGVYASPACNRTIESGPNFVKTLQSPTTNSYNSSFLISQRENAQPSARESSSRLGSLIGGAYDSNRETDNSHRISFESARAIPVASAPIIKVNGDPIHMENSINIVVKANEPPLQQNNYQNLPQYQAGNMHIQQQNFQMYQPGAHPSQYLQVNPTQQNQCHQVNQSVQTPKSSSQKVPGLSSLLQNVNIASPVEKSNTQRAINRVETKAEKPGLKMQFLQVPNLPSQVASSQRLPTSDLNMDQFKQILSIHKEIVDDETPEKEEEEKEYEKIEKADNTNMNIKNEKATSIKLEESRNRAAENIVNGNNIPKKVTKSKYDDIVKKCVERTQNALKLVNGQASFSTQNISLFNETMESINRDSVSFLMDQTQQEIRPSKFSNSSQGEVKALEKVEVKPQTEPKSYTSNNKSKIEEMFNNAMSRSKSILGKYPSVGKPASPSRVSFTKRDSNHSATQANKGISVENSPLHHQQQQQSYGNVYSVQHIKQTEKLSDSYQSNKNEKSRNIKPILTLYKGDLVETVKSGRGLGTYHNGDQYEGSWVENCRTGFGTLRDQQGNLIYSGDWLSDEFHGQGVYRNAKPEPISGMNFKDFGFEYDRFCDQYEGEFREGFRNGFGTVLFTSGDKFLGKFVKNNIHGEGTFYSKSGEIIIGFWENNKLIRKI